MEEEKHKKVAEEGEGDIGGLLEGKGLTSMKKESSLSKESAGELDLEYERKGSEIEEIAGTEEKEEMIKQIKEKLKKNIPLIMSRMLRKKAKKELIVKGNMHHKYDMTLKDALNFVDIAASIHF